MQTGRQVDKEQVDKEKKLVYSSTCLLVFLLAALLRFYRLDAQSFWNDEGNSARLSERTLQSITVGTASDIHPPLYYYTLHFWRAIFGHTEFALRALSVLCGVVLVWLIYLIGKQLFDEPVALLAALIAAINPFQIYYSQEVRMYAMLAVWAAASVYFVFSISNLQSPTSNQLPLYVFASAAGLYTQYTFVFILLIHNIVMLISLIVWREKWLRRALVWAGLQAAIVVLYLPWLPVALARTGGWGVETQPYALGAALLDVARLFAYGLTLPTSQPSLGLAAVALLVLAAVWFRGKEEAVRVGALLVWWLLPAMLVFGLGLYREAYLKFLLVSSAPVCLLLACGIVNAWRVSRRCARFSARALQVGVLIIALLAAWPLAQSLYNLYFDPAYARDDYRGIAQFVRSVERPDDAVLLIAPNQWEVFTYYYTDADRVYPLARHRPPDPAVVDAEMREIAAKHARLFVLYWGDVEVDPQRTYEAWLEANTYKAGEQWWGKVRLAIYAVPQSVADAPTQSLEVRFGPSIYLRGYTLLTPSASPGGVISLALFWQSDALLSERYKVFVHLVNEDGQIIVQVDREPGADLLPTTIWQLGQTVVDRYGVLLPADIPPGRYAFVVGLYDFSGQRLPIAQGGQGDALHLFEITVTR